MLQRVQSLYLLVVIVSYVLLFFFPFAEFTVNNTEYYFSLLKVSNGNSNSTIPLIAAVGLLCITVLVTIFLYKKRILQIRIIAIVLLAHIGFIVALFYVSGSIASMLTPHVANAVEVATKYDTGTYIVLIPLVFLVLANRAIRKDEKLVRSTDRIR